MSKEFLIDIDTPNIDIDVGVSGGYLKPANTNDLRRTIELRLLLDGNDADLTDIDVSNIKFMNGLFKGLDPHNIDISNWDVSHVIDMEEMFYNCVNFNCDLSKWKVSKVRNMNRMFVNCKNFDRNCTNNWDIKDSIEVSEMFFGCKNN